MQSLLARVDETNPPIAAADDSPLAALALDLEQIRAEILALYKAALPPAIIHQITRGAHEQLAIGRMMLDDCTLREANGTLNPKHLANAKRWIAGVRLWIKNREAAYSASTRRKFYVIKPPR
jgi:hypothetical protein